MSKEAKSECPMCAEPNYLTVAYCYRCRYRLPWADSLEGIQHASEPSEESLLDRELKAMGLLPARALACRFCEKPIAVDERQCPHCKRWLDSGTRSFALDP